MYLSRIGQQLHNQIPDKKVVKQYYSRVDTSKKMTELGNCSILSNKQTVDEMSFPGQTNQNEHMTLTLCRESGPRCEFGHIDNLDCE